MMGMETKSTTVVFIFQDNKTVRLVFLSQYVKEPLRDPSFFLITPFSCAYLFPCEESIFESLSHSFIEVVVTRPFFSLAVVIVLDHSSKIKMPMLKSFVLVIVVSYHVISH